MPEPADSAEPTSIVDKVYERTEQLLVGSSRFTAQKAGDLTARLRSPGLSVDALLQSLSDAEETTFEDS